MFDGKTIWFVVRGISGKPGDLLEWEYEGRDFLIQSTNSPAVAISYNSEFWNVWRQRSWRSRRFAQILRGYTSRNWRVNIISHSEGTVVATDALNFLGWPRIENLHLVCGACDSDFGRLGINSALKGYRLNSVHCWIAGRDTAMQFENLTLGRMLFQIHRPLGLKGPSNVKQQFRDRVIEHFEPPWDEYGHSDCWLKPNFDRTMGAFMRASEPA